MFLTSYQSFALLCLSKQLNFMTMSSVKTVTSHIYRINGNDLEWDDDRDIYKSGRLLHIMQTKQPHLIPMLIKSRTKKFCPKTLIIKDSQLSWIHIKKIAMNVNEFILDNTTITEMPPTTQGKTE